MNIRRAPEPIDRMRGIKSYRSGRTGCPTDLRLDGNEGRVPDASLLASLVDGGPELLRRYPNRHDLETRLAARFDLDPRSVLVTAGADDALDRLCRSFLEPGRNLVVASPTFVMIPRYARLAGADIREVPWTEDRYPIEAILERVDHGTGIVAVVTPNNPTGAVATADDLERLSSAAPEALLLVDLAYGEFADKDLMPTVLGLPNAVAVRSLSKAWGLAGLRVGYAAGPSDLIEPLRAAGSPYAVSGPSLQIALAALDNESQVVGFTDLIRGERAVLADELRSLGAEPFDSQANFVYAKFANPVWVRDGLAGMGIAVRLFDDKPMRDPLRISCPGSKPDFDRLCRCLRTVLAPEALLFDMDGVLADVSESYRRAILETAKAFGADFTVEDIAAAKRRIGSNNDWVLTRDLLAEHGVKAELDDIIAKFQSFYLELAVTEKLIPPRELLVRLAERIPLGIVTGRPGGDARIFLERMELIDLFSTVVCLEDGPGKPDPTPINLAMASLGVTRGWMVGDTVNDIVAARTAGILPLGVVPPGENFVGYGDLLTRNGAGRVLSSLSELEEVLPL